MTFKCHKCGLTGFSSRVSLVAHGREYHPRPDRHYFAPECPRRHSDSKVVGIPQKRRFVPQKVTRLDLEEMLENLMLKIGQVLTITGTTNIQHEMKNLRQTFQTIKRKLC